MGVCIFFQLRNQRIRCAESLEQFLHHPDPDTCNKVCKQLQQELGDGVMLGFEELSEQQRTGMSFNSMRLSGDILPKATLLITSRTLATVSLHQLLPHMNLINILRLWDLKMILRHTLIQPSVITLNYVITSKRISSLILLHTL